MYLRDLRCGKSLRFGAREQDSGLWLSAWATCAGSVASVSNRSPRGCSRDSLGVYRGYRVETRQESGGRVSLK